MTFTSENISNANSAVDIIIELSPVKETNFNSKEDMNYNENPSRNCKKNHTGYFTPPIDPAPIANPPLLKQRSSRDPISETEIDSVSLPLLPSERMILADRDYRMNSQNFSDIYGFQMRPRVELDSNILHLTTTNEEISLHSLLFLGESVRVEDLNGDPQLEVPTPRYRHVGSTHDGSTFLGAAMVEPCCSWPDIVAIGHDVYSAFDQVKQSDKELS